MSGRIDPSDPRVATLVGQFQHSQIDRRQLLTRGAALLGSLAAANGLLAALTLPPASPRVAGAFFSEGMFVDYPGPGEGYVATPDGAGAYPGVIVVQEWWGIDDHIKSVVRRLAAEGFVAIAPDLYHGQVATEPDEARKYVMELEQDVALEEIQNAANYLISRPDVSSSKVGIVGFCMGGGLALQMAVRGENFAVAAPFYGSPLNAEQAAQVKIPVIGSYGEMDQSIPVPAVRAMEEAIRAAGQRVDIQLYPAGHAFFNDDRESFHAESAADAWMRTLTAFRRYLF